MAIPLFHVYGMVAGMSFGMASAASLVMIPNPRDMDDLLDNIAKYRPTIYPGVPTMYNAINVNPRVKAGEVDVTCIRACISGSAPLMKETKDTFENLVQAGVIDPAKVTRSALQNAASAASMLITTEAMVSEIKEEKEKAPAGMPPGGMGGMPPM